MSGFFGVVVLIVGLAGFILGMITVVKAFQRCARLVDPVRLLTPPFSAWRQPFGNHFLAGSGLVSVGIIAMAFGVRFLR